MTGDARTPAAKLQDLAARAWTDQTRRTERYSEVMQRLARGDLSEQQVREEFTRFASEETTSFFGEAAGLALEYYAALLDLGRDYDDRFYERVLGGRGSRTRAEGSRRDPPTHRIPMELRGPAGGEARAAFVIENKRETTAEISFVVSDFVDGAGGHPFRPPLEVQPPRLTLGPHEEAEVSLRLPLLHERFRSGHDYRALVLVRGHDALELLLTVRVEAAPEPATRVSVVTEPEGPEPDDPPETKPRPRKRRAPAKKGTRGSTKKK